MMICVSVLRISIIYNDNDVVELLKLIEYIYFKFV